MENVLIIGATSAIAMEAAKLYAEKGAKLCLLARNGERLKAIAKDLEIRGASLVECRIFSAELFENHFEDIEFAFHSLKKIHTVLLAHGSLPDQKACETDFNLVLEGLKVNILGTLSLLTHLANRLERQKSGTLVVITSVAGDRGRRSNYLYGASKSMISTFLQGLRARLHSAQVHVLDAKPGFVDTPMTEKFEKNFLWTKPKTVARGILLGVKKKKNTLYIPFFWKIIMFFIKIIPEKFFKKMKF